MGHPLPQVLQRRSEETRNLEPNLEPDPQQLPIDVIRLTEAGNVPLIWHFSQDGLPTMPGVLQLQPISSGLTCSQKVPVGEIVGDLKVILLDSILLGDNIPPTQ